MCSKRSQNMALLLLSAWGCVCSLGPVPNFCFLPSSLCSFLTLRHLGEQEDEEEETPLMLFLWKFTSVLSFLLPWDLQVYERAPLERVICREAFTGFFGRPLTGHIIVLQINMSWPERRQPHSMWQKFLWGNALSRKWSWTSPLRMKSAWRGSCWSAVSCSNCKSDPAPPGVRGGERQDTGHSAPCSTLLCSEPAFGGKGCVLGSVVNDFYSLCCLQGLSSSISPRVASNCSLGVIILISHWFYTENRRWFGLYLFFRKCLFNSQHFSTFICFPMGSHNI